MIERSPKGKGYKDLSQPAPPPGLEPLWETYREDFPVASRLIYLNHAAVAPLCAPAAAAMKELAEDAWMYGSFHYDQWLAAYEGLRLAAARMLNAHRDEIAIVKNTSEGIATVALGIDWRPGDRVVAFARGVSGQPVSLADAGKKRSCDYSAASGGEP